MKMAKPSQRDIDAAGDLMTLLHQIDRGDYPCVEEGKDVPDWFDEHDYEHLRALYGAIKATLDKGPGYPGRVIGGMCYVIMWDKNKIVDPESDVIDLHPELVKAQVDAERYRCLRNSEANMSYLEGGWGLPAGEDLDVAVDKILAEAASNENGQRGSEA